MAAKIYFGSCREDAPQLDSCTRLAPSSRLHDIHGGFRKSAQSPKRDQPMTYTIHGAELGDL